ncbi:MAG: AzlC family ABC transporter permease [Pseudomonadota bacterium]
MQTGSLSTIIGAIADAYRTPGLYILGMAMMGFGALARDAGFSLDQTVLMSAIIFQLPGQLVLVDQMSQGAGLLVAAFAVPLTAVRLLPMTVVLLPYLRGGGAPRWQLAAASHLVAVTAWVECLRRLPDLPERARFAYFVGFGGTMITTMIVLTGLGFVIAATTPPLMTATLAFMTPIYFAVSMMAAASARADWLAIIFGALLGPPLFLLAPGIDLALTGLIAGGAAFVIGGRLATVESTATEPHQDNPTS